MPAPERFYTSIHLCNNTDVRIEARVPELNVIQLNFGQGTVVFLDLLQAAKLGCALGEALIRSANMVQASAQIPSAN